MEESKMMYSCTRCQHSSLKCSDDPFKKVYVKTVKQVCQKIRHLCKSLKKVIRSPFSRRKYSAVRNNARLAEVRRKLPETLPPVKS